MDLADIGWGGVEWMFLSRKMLRISCVAEQLAASQKGTGSKELVSHEYGSNLIYHNERSFLVKLQSHEEVCVCK
jgi:hypothetical protein